MSYLGSAGPHPSDNREFPTLSQYEGSCGASGILKTFSEIPSDRPPHRVADYELEGLCRVYVVLVC